MKIFPDLSAQKFKDLPWPVMCDINFCVDKKPNFLSSSNMEGILNWIIKPFDAVKVDHLKIILCHVLCALYIYK